LQRIILTCYIYNLHSSKKIRYLKKDKHHAFDSYFELEKEVKDL
jgi:hypothetical protein